MKKPFFFFLLSGTWFSGVAQTQLKADENTDTTQSLEQVVVQSFGYNAHPICRPPIYTGSMELILRLRRIRHRV